MAAKVVFVIIGLTLICIESLATTAIGVGLRVLAKTLKPNEERA
jgi:hypothetical protein